MPTINPSTAKEDQIRRVEDARGYEVEFGNPFFPGHPRPQDLDDDRGAEA